MRKWLTGIVHVHSDFSRDGLHSVADLAAFAREAGFQFIALTDHAEDLSSKDMNSLRQECEEHSDETCVLIPGLEFRCDGDIHILGLGTTGTMPSTDPVAVARHIQDWGGISVLAHPGRNGYEFPRELCTVLNGIEIWNAGYDGQFVPPMANLRLLQEAQAANPNVLGFGGADLHGFDRPAGVMLHVSENGSGRVDTKMVLDGLRSGRFSVHGTYLSFDATRGSHRLGEFPLKTFRKLYEISRAARNAVLGES